MLDLKHESGKTDFGMKMKEARKKCGLSQEEFREKLDLDDRSTISSWENGRTLPEINKIPEICSVLNVDTGYLFGDYDSSTFTTQTIVNNIGLSESAIEKLTSLHFENSATGTIDILTHLINHPNFQYFLSLLANSASGTTDAVTFGNTTIAPDRKAIINSELKDVVIEIASDIRKKYKPNENAMLYHLLFGLYHEGRVTFEQLQRTKQEYDNGNYDYTPNIRQNNE